MTAQRERPSAAASAAPERVRSRVRLLLRRDDVARTLPFAAYLLFIAIADGMARMGWSEAELRCLYPVKVGIVLALLIAYRRHYSELAVRAPSFPVAAGSVLTGVVVLVLWVSLDASWMLLGTSAGFDPTGPGGRIDWLLVGIRIAGAALVVPVMEELFWRSFLLRWLSRPEFLSVYPGKVGIAALAISSVLFGIEHSQWFAGVVAGICYGVLYMRTSNIWAPILAHAVTNGLLGGWIVATKAWTYW